MILCLLSPCIPIRPLLEKQRPRGLSTRPKITQLVRGVEGPRTMPPEAVHDFSMVPREAGSGGTPDVRRREDAVGRCRVSWLWWCPQARASPRRPSRLCGVAQARCPVRCWAAWSRDSCVTAGRTVWTAPMRGTVVSRGPSGGPEGFEVMWMMVARGLSVWGILCLLFLAYLGRNRGRLGVAESEKKLSEKKHPGMCVSLGVVKRGDGTVSSPSLFHKRCLIFEGIPPTIH